MYLSLPGRTNLLQNIERQRALCRKRNMAVLVTGGAGFIGSHTVVELLDAGYDVVIADNLYNSKEMVIDRIEKIAGRRPRFYKQDICDRAGVEAIFEKEEIDAVIHFAGYKAVGESTRMPIEYYRNNLDSTLTLCDVMRNHGCKKIVFSSSATVYGDPAFVPITEECPKGLTTNPYGETKSMQERILTDIWRAPKGIPNNLLPYVAQVASGKLEKIHVFGNDYDTPDGTGVRDYIHVVDLARGHVKAIEGIEKLEGVNVFNLGTGIGYSVLDIIKAFSNGLTWLFLMNPITVLTAPNFLALYPVASCNSICTRIEWTVAKVTSLQFLMARKIVTIIIKAFRTFIS